MKFPSFLVHEILIALYIYKSAQAGNKQKLEKLDDIGNTKWRIFVLV